MIHSKNVGVAIMARGRQQHVSEISTRISKIGTFSPAAGGFFRGAPGQCRPKAPMHHPGPFSLGSAPFTRHGLKMGGPMG